jgi:hypothetical protein
MESIILYAIVGAIYLYFNSKKAKNKGKVNKPQPNKRDYYDDADTETPTQPEPVTFSDLLETLMGGEDITKPPKPRPKRVQTQEVERPTLAPVPPPKPVVTFEQEIEMQQREMQKRISEEEARFTKKKQERELLEVERKKAAHLRHMAEKARLHTNKDLQIHGKSTPRKTKKFNFNLKDAVIDNAILERPYQ